MSRQEYAWRVRAQSPLSKLFESIESIEVRHVPDSANLALGGAALDPCAEAEIEGDVH